MEPPSFSNCWFTSLFLVGREEEWKERGLFRDLQPIKSCLREDILEPPRKPAAKSKQFLISIVCELFDNWKGAVGL